MSRSITVRRPSRRAARIAAFAAVPAALLLSGTVVAGASYSAFSATTTNPTNNWSTGTVALSDDDSNTAMFTATGLKPGSTGTHCIAVTSTGSLPSAVKLYGSGETATNALDQYITLTVTQGTGGSFAGGCGSFVADSTGQIFNNTLNNFTYTNYSNGIGTWAPTGSASETKVYKFTYTVSSTAPSTTQGSSASIGFTWEVQNS